jgi:hypothetical protein
VKTSTSNAVRNLSERRRLLPVAGLALVTSTLLLALLAPSGGRASNVTASADSRPPTQTIFASSSQRVGSLYLLITVHESGRLRVTASAGSYHFRSVSKRVTQHIPNQVRLKLSSTALRSARRAIRRGRSLTATVQSRGTDRAGNSRTYTKRIKLRS